MLIRIKLSDHHLIVPIIRLLLIVIVVFATQSSFSQKLHRDSILPIWLTEEEKQRLHEINFDKDPTDPPPQPARSIAEFEPMSGVLIRYPLGIPLALVSLMSEEIEVITLVADEETRNQAIIAYQNNGVNMDNSSFLIATTNSIWTRDYGPWFAFDSNNEIGIIDFEYDRPRPLDNAIPGIFADEYEVNYFHMGLVHTGGDYMSDGMGVAASTEAVYAVNSGYSHSEVDSIMQLFLGVNEYHVVPNIHGGLSHIDTWGKFLSPDKIMIREVPESHQYYYQAEQAVAYFESHASSYGTPYSVFRVYTPNNEPYTNSLIVNNRVFVPTTGSSYDDAAVQAFEEAMPGYDVYGVPFGGWGSTDALHCRVREIADREMLYVYHEPVVEDKQYHYDYKITARIIPMSGEALYEDSLRVYYKVNEEDYSFEIMTAEEDYWYSAYIPQQEVGSEISYYIHAADESGRSENHPYIGQYDPHTFNIASPLVFLGAEVDDSTYGNDNGVFEPGETVELVVSYTNTGLEPLYSIAAQLQTSSQFVTIHPPEIVVHESIEPEEELEFRFIVSASLAAPDVYLALFDLEVDADGDYNSFDRVEIELNAYIVEEYLVQESFDEWLPEGWEVTSSAGNVNWQHSNTSLAGGNAPEAQFHYEPSTAAVQRLITPGLNTNGYSLVALEFNHFINDYSGGYSIRVETSGDGGDTWKDIMVFTDDDMPATREKIIIDNEDVGSENFRIAWTFEGDSWDINWWNIDDIVVAVAYTNFHKPVVEGQVFLSGGPGMIADVMITDGDNVTYPDEDGFFSLELLEGSHNITASLKDYLPETIEDVSVAEGDTMVVEFYLEYIAPPVNLAYEIGFDEINLMWEVYDPIIAVAGYNTDSYLNITMHGIKNIGFTNKSIGYYNIYRSVDNNDFVFIGTSAGTEYVDEVTQDGAYKYYVTAVYEHEHYDYESEPSNVVSVEVAVNVGDDLISIATGLRGNYPNPFSSETTIEFSLALPGFVTIDIFNSSGQKVKTLVEAKYDAGNHQVKWNGAGKSGSAVAGGVYFYRLRSKDHVESNRMLLINQP